MYDPNDNLNSKLKGIYKTITWECIDAIDIFRDGLLHFFALVVVSIIHYIVACLIASVLEDPIYHIYLNASNNMHYRKPENWGRQVVLWITSILIVISIVSISTHWFVYKIKEYKASDERANQEVYEENVEKFGENWIEQLSLNTLTEYYDAKTLKRLFQIREERAHCKL